MFSLGMMLGILVGLVGILLIYFGIRPAVGKAMTPKRGAACSAAVLGVLAADFGGGWLPKTPIFAVAFTTTDSQAYVAALLVLESIPMVTLALFYLDDLIRALFAARRQARASG